MTTLADIAKAQADADHYNAVLAQVKAAYVPEAPKITVVLLDETKLVPGTVMANYAKVLQDAINLLRTKWTHIPEVVVTRTKTKGGWEVAISTEANTRRSSADGWHSVSPTGAGYAYVVGRSGMFPYGFWQPARSGRPETLHSNVLTVLVHETLEMICDPALKTLSSPDKNGHKWLIEVCSSSMFGTYWHYKEPVSKVDCVMPGFAYPSAFDLKGEAPFDNLNWLKFPFDRTAKSYPYYEGANGKLVKV